jgi:hypothetical protein
MTKSCRGNTVVFEGLPEFGFIESRDQWSRNSAATGGGFAQRTDRCVLWY